MGSTLFRHQSCFLLRNVHKVLSSSQSCPFSSDKFKKGKKPFMKPVTKSLNKINLLGALGIASALLTSYIIVRKNYVMEGKDLNNLKTVRPKRIPDQNVIMNPPANVADSDKKEEHLREKYNFIKKVVNECASAVFYLELRDPTVKDPETGQSIVTSNGSGFIISEDGWALTNAHVVLNKPQSTITAIMRDGRSFQARIEDADMNIDLALLKLESKEKLPSLQFGKIGDTSVGEWVIALGSPLSLSNSVTVGIVSSVDRPAEELGLKNFSMAYIQTDASITFGNSGGPLVNLDGHVIGINNLRLTSGISFAIPVEYVMKFLENTKYRIKNPTTSKKIGKALFGLTTISITPELLTHMHNENSDIPNEITNGLLVWKIIPGTPADKCGLEVGDIITHVNGILIQKPIELYSFTSSRDSLEIEIIKKGKKKTITLNLD